MSKEVIMPRIIADSPVQTLRQLVDGWRSAHVGKNRLLYPDIVWDLRNPKGGEQTLKIDLMRVKGLVAKVNFIRGGQLGQGDFDSHSGYVENPKDKNTLLPASYIRPIEFYYAAIEENDKEAYAIAVRRNLLDKYVPLEPQDWPPQYWEYEAIYFFELARQKMAQSADTSEVRGLSHLAQSCLSYAQELRRLDRMLPEKKLEPIPKDQVPRESWYTQEEWNEMLKSLQTWEHKGNRAYTRNRR